MNRSRDLDTLSTNRAQRTATTSQLAITEATCRLEAVSRVLVHDVMDNGSVDADTALWASTMVDTAARWIAQVAA